MRDDRGRGYAAFETRALLIIRRPTSSRYKSTPVHGYLVSLVRSRAPLFDAAGPGPSGCGRAASSASGYRARRRRRRDPSAASAREARRRDRAPAEASSGSWPRGKYASTPSGAAALGAAVSEGGGARSARRASATASKGAALVDTRTREDASRASASRCEEDDA